MEELVFVIIRHVNNKVTDEYWKTCYRCLRKFYPAHENKIIIIDDNSNKMFLKEDIEMENCETIYSEYQGRGEILGYYYFYKMKAGKKAVVIHDSVFFNTKIDFNKYVDVVTLWSFEQIYDNVNGIKTLIGKLSNSEELMGYYDKYNMWKGCFGVMAVCRWEVLDKIDKRYNFFEVMMENVTNREERMLVERVFAVACAYNYPEYCEARHVISNIHQQGWGLNYEGYKNGKGDHLKVIKVWTGR